MYNQIRDVGHGLQAPGIPGVIWFVNLARHIIKCPFLQQSVGCAALSPSKSIKPQVIKTEDSISFRVVAKAALSFSKTVTLEPNDCTKIRMFSLM